MKALSVILLSLTLSIVSIPQAKANNFVIVAGTTKNGSRLMFAPSSVNIKFPQNPKEPMLGDYNRYFNYAVLRKDGSQSINLGAYTHWCRNGKVEVDGRAVDPQNFFFMKIYNNIDVMKNPGWFTDNGYIFADSPASINLLKTVCAAKHVPAHGIFD